MAQHSLPSLINLCIDLSNETTAFNYLLHVKALKKPEKCPFCDHPDLSLKRPPTYYRCKGCRKGFSMLSSTFFANSKLPLSEILLFGYLWVTRAPVSLIRSAIPGLSSATATCWGKHFTQLVAWDMMHNEQKIGGPNVVVEIDESKFGKRMYNRGHRIEGVWVVGGVERTAERRMFAIRVEDRTAKTLMDIIESYVLPGSIVITDCWKGYASDQLQAMGIKHLTVNHSIQFVNPETGAHTNTIEGTWSGMKMKIHKRHRTSQFMEGELFRIIWERVHKEGLWARLLHAMGTVRYV